MNRVPHGVFRTKPVPLHSTFFIIELPRTGWRSSGLDRLVLGSAVPFVPFAPPRLMADFERVKWMVASGELVYGGCCMRSFATRSSGPRARRNKQQPGSDLIPGSRTPTPPADMSLPCRVCQSVYPH